MHVVRLSDAPTYEAPGHSGMELRRLQGREAGLSDTLWIGRSVLEPGGRTDLRASRLEKFYVVLEGRLTVSTATAEDVLAAGDSCRIAPHEARELRNDTEGRVVVLLAMPLEDAAPA